MTAVLIFSLYSYAFNVTRDAPLLINTTPEEPVELTGMPEDTVALLTATPSTASPAYMDDYAPADIETFRDLFGSNSFVHMSRGNRDLKEVSLTFDGGTANHAKEILRILREKDIKTTIFLTGRFIRKNPETVGEMLADGHEIGNHTMSHPHLTNFDKTLVHSTLPRITKKYFLKQILSTAKIYRELTGQELAPFWRAPFGEINQELTQWAFEAGFVHVGWTADYKRRKSLDTLDWVRDKDSKNYYTAGEIRERILDFDTLETGLKGGIILMHLGTNRREDHVVSVLPEIIDDLRHRGYRFVKISKMATAKFTPKSDPLKEILVSSLK